MKNYPSEKIRNLVITGHGSSGKTSLTEALLYTAGAISRLGKVEDGTTTSDFDPDEIKRKISISSSLAPLEYQDHRINLIDTPGYADFIGEVISALRAADLVLVNVCAVAGVEVQTEKVFNYAEEQNLPRVFFINKMDKEHANFSQTLSALKKTFSKNVVPLEIPIGAQNSFEGVVNLVRMKAYYSKDEKSEEKDIPEELKTSAAKAREELTDAVADTSDELLEKYLEAGELSDAELKTALKTSIASSKVFPVVCGSALKNIGTDSLLSLIVDCFPSPTSQEEIKGKVPKTGEEMARPRKADQPLSALVFKTVTDPYLGRLNYVRVFSGSLRTDFPVFNVTKQKRERVGHLLTLRGKSQEDTKEVTAGDIVAIPKLEVTEGGDTLSAETSPIVLEPIKFPPAIFSVAIEPKSKGDEEKISTSLSKLAEEDPTLEVRRDAETKQTVISGVGDLHLEIITDRLKRKFGVEVTLAAPKIPYRETVKTKAKAQGKYKKQTGGRGQYGDAWLELEPLGHGGGFEFVDKIVGGAIPRGFIPAVEKGVKEATEEGVMAGYPVVDIRVTLYDGSYHSVDSSEMAFKIAGSLAFKKAVLEAKPVLLEPIVNIEVIVPDNLTGDVIGGLSGKRGKVLGVEPRTKNQAVKALVPLAEIAKYSTELRSTTHGQGAYSIEFSHYEEVPRDISERIIAEAKEKTKKE